MRREGEVIDMTKVTQITLVLAGAGIGFWLQPYLKSADPPLSTIGVVSPALGAFLGLQVARSMTGESGSK